MAGEGHELYWRDDTLFINLATCRCYMIAHGYRFYNFQWFTLK